YSRREVRTMACQTIYDEMMSLQLDGLLDGAEERRLLEHIGGCMEGATLWGAMNEAHVMLVASASEPVAVPFSVQVKIMERVALSPVFRPSRDWTAETQPALLVPAGLSVLPASR